MSYKDSRTSWLYKSLKSQKTNGKNYVFMTNYKDSRIFSFFVRQSLSEATTSSISLRQCVSLLVSTCIAMQYCAVRKRE